MPDDDKTIPPEESAPATDAATTGLSPTDEAVAEGADVTSIEEARRRRQQEQEQAEAGEGGEKEEGGDAPGRVQIGLGELLAPVVASIAQEVARYADDKGVVQMTDDEEENRKKTAAILKGLGQGLGVAIAQAFAKWATKVETGQAPRDDEEGEPREAGDTAATSEAPPASDPPAASDAPARSDAPPTDGDKPDSN